MQATKIQFPLSYKGGERLFVHHKEPNRYKLYNAMQNKPLPPILSEDKLVNTTYQFGYNGLSVLNSHSPDALSLSDTAAGLSQAMAASELTSEIYCNLENVGASFFTQAPVPSSSPRSDRHNPW